MFKYLFNASLILVMLSGILKGDEDESGINMLYSRNFFSGSMNHLKQIDADGEAPFRIVTVPSFEARSPWNKRRTERLGRLYGLIMKGWIIPEHDGDYTFSAQCNGSMVMVLSENEKESDGRILRFSGIPKGEIETTDGYTPNRRAAETVNLRAGIPYFVKVFFLPGWRDRLAVGWEVDGNSDTRQIIPEENLRTAIN